MSAAAVPGRTATASGTSAAVLQVPSPDWRDQVIYFVMTDRFDDGDPRNNDQHTGEFDAGDGAKYNGGDLRGIERRIDYIRGLGATAVWITPPVANVWWDATARHGGYHGYWAENFMAVDAHLGSLRDYQRLSKRIHGAGMFLVQDIVLNHTGSYFDYEGGWEPGNPAAFFKLVTDGRGRNAPSQWPFGMNDARVPAQRAAGIYHWTPRVVDYNDAAQVHDNQMSGLDDLNSENPLVRRALRRSYAYWIREAGVDAFRIDTAFYVPNAALHDFLYSRDASAPGILAVARATGHKAFHVFGEGFASDRAYEEIQARRIDALMREPDGAPLLPGMINFPLYATLGDVFARGRPPAELAYRIDSMMRVHEHPELMPTFLDNHDVDRFLVGGSEAGLKQGLLLMMTLPGIPTIYYGTEQGFTVTRAAMFKSGSDSGGRDHFDVNSPLYSYIQRATTLRREHRVFSRGRPTMLRGNAATPGVLAYRMDDGKESAIVVFNSSNQPALLDNLDAGAGKGAVLRGLFNITGPIADVVADSHGRISLVLPARAGVAWLVTSTNRPASAEPDRPSVDGSGDVAASGDFRISGHAEKSNGIQLVVDEDLSTATVVPVGTDGRWSAMVDTRRMIDPSTRHRLVAWDGRAGIASPALGFRVSREWKQLVDLADPVGDDDGPAHRYVYPTDAGWGSHRQMDIQHVTVSGAGGALRIVLRMNDISTPWNPPNGFDHVAFNVFVELPGRTDGVRPMPRQNATLPGGMRWHYRLRAHGWSNAMFSASGASATSDGTPVSPAASIAVDVKARTVTFTLPNAALGNVATLSGARLYINTWDYDGGFRPLQPEPAGSIFGGGNGASDPLVMDETAVITLP